MSKYDKIRGEFPLVTEATSKKLYAEDWTPSKKYFPFMVQLWDSKSKYRDSFTSQQLVKMIKKFDELLPYIENKDIYSSQYKSFGNVQAAINAAELVKEEKTFVRDEHIEVLEETDEYIFLSPKTLRGSLKYGAGTRWCTASKHDESTFNRYNKNGFLAYLILKNDSMPANYRKLGFWSEEVHSPIAGEIMIYNANDDNVGDYQLTQAGWAEGLIFKLFTLFRQKSYMKIKTKNAETSVKRKLSALSNFDFQELQRDLDFLDHSTRRMSELHHELGGSVQQILQQFVEQIKTKMETQNG
jgi:hypothetical protein